MTTLSSHSISELREKLTRGEVSSEQLVTEAINNTKKTASLNAFVTVCEAEAIAQAKRCDERLKRGDKAPLLGVPVAVKDMILTRGIRSTAGSKMLSDFIPPYDATVTKKLIVAGAVIVGKTNQDEFAMGSSSESSYFGPTKNPWDTARVPGGSSGGSAVAVAAGVVPMALGTDTGGSIRQPASMCSVVGIKPTYGRVSRYGVIAYASSLDQVGPIARNVSDAAISLSVLAGHDELDSTSANMAVPNYESLLGGGIKGLRLGVPKEYFQAGISSEVASAVKAALEKLASLGAQIVEIALPTSKVALSTYYIIAPAEASSNLSRYDGIRYGHRAEGTSDLRALYCKTRSEGFGAEVKRRILIGTHVLSTGYYDAYYLKAQKVRQLIAQDFKNAFDKHCDVIVGPVAPTTAFKIGEKLSDPLAMYLEDVYTVPVNLAGLPGLSVPCGFDSNRLPIGLQFIGKPFDEATLLRAGYSYEQATEWHKAKAPFIAQ